MAKYQVRVRELEAVQFDGSNWIELSVFTGTREVDGHHLPLFNPAGTHILALFMAGESGVAEMYSDRRKTQVGVKVGDWIVKHSEASFEVYSDGAFREMCEVPHAD